MRFSTGQVSWLLAGLAVAAIVANLWMWQNGSVNPMLIAAAGMLVAMLVAYPFLLGWRPRPAERRLRPCTACGTLWSPREAGQGFCPACGIEGV